jgi:hypothetical protein
MTSGIAGQGPTPVQQEPVQPGPVPQEPVPQDPVRPVSDEDRVWVSLAGELTPAKSLERVDTATAGWSAP